MRQKEPKTRQKIIKNALKMFAQEGFYRTTMEDIAAATGVAKGTVYLYFKDKHCLYTATIEDQFNRFLDMLNDIEQAPGTPGLKMERIAKDLVEYIKAIGTSYLPFTVESLSLRGSRLKDLHSAIEPKLRQMTEIIGGIIREGIEQNEFRPVNPRLAAFHFLSTIREVFLSRLYVNHDPVETDDMLGLYFEGLNKRR